MLHLCVHKTADAKVIFETPCLPNGNLLLLSKDLYYQDKRTKGGVIDFFPHFL